MFDVLPFNHGYSFIQNLKHNIVTKKNHSRIAGTDIPVPIISLYFVTFFLDIGLSFLILLNHSALKVCEIMLNLMSVV